MKVEPQMYSCDLENPQRIQLNLDFLGETLSPDSPIERSRKGLGFFSTFGIIPYVNVILSPVLAKNNVVDCTEWKKEKVFFCVLQRKMVCFKVV